MRPLYIKITVLMVIASTMFCQAQPTSLWEAVQDTALITRQGYTLRVMMNSNGILGATIYPSDSGAIYGWNVTGLEYPVGSGYEHLAQAGPWIGGIIRTPQGNKKAVTTVVSFDPIVIDGEPSESEMIGHETIADTFFQSSILRLDCCNRKNFDDDGDGRIDEDPPDNWDNDGDWIQIRDDINHDGRPNRGEPHVDEDYGAVSENDVYVTYRDSFASPHFPRHIPLGLRVFQKSYAWRDRVKEPILFFEYEFTRSGMDIEANRLDSVYLGFYASTSVHPRGFISNNGLLLEYAGYLPSVRTAFSYSALPITGEISPVGITLLGASKPLSSLKLSYHNYNPDPFTGNPPFTDADRYKFLSDGNIDPNKSRMSNLWGAELLLSVGPFHPMRPGETLKLAIAFVCGNAMDAGPNNLKANARKAIELYEHGYLAPSVPPSPPLKLTPLRNGVQLDFQWRAGDPRFDPLEAWDDSNRIVTVLPDTHWRRRNPPPGKSAGGRIFEGFRIWRSEYPAFQENQFSLLKQFDIDDDLRFEGQTGIQFSYVDTPLVRGRRYWYAVTSISIPDYVFIENPTNGGGTVVDTTLSDPVESPLSDNAINYAVPFLPAIRPGEVKVVPNPYRGDENYTYEGGGWEGLGRTWNEEKRLVWFIHLPKRCTLRIFTVMGEVVKVIEHDDDERTSRSLPVGQEEFTLLSESNRALASGVYVYLVESPLGTQMGKFVVIR